MPRESFVVWMDGPVDPNRAQECTGRVEHVATSERLRFNSAEELIAFLMRGPEEKLEGILESKEAHPVFLITGALSESPRQPT